MRKLALKKEYDMTSGPLFGKIVALALPLALSGILQLLFNSADLVVIGQFSATSTESLAAVSSNNALINLIVNVSIGLSVGANVVMAHAIGAKDGERAERVLHTSMLLSVICGVAMGIVGVFMAHLFLAWMKTDPAVIGKATDYLRIYFIGTPANIIYNFGAAILRAKGDTKRPLFYLAIAGVLNACLNLIFVICAGLDVKGVAIATIVSQYISMILVIIALLREKGYCKMELKKLTIKKRELFDILKVGLPSGILSSFFSIANVIIQSSINGFGPAVMAGNSTGSALEGFVYTSMNAVSSTATTFAGQNYGAKKYDRINTVMWECSLLIVIISVVMGGAILLLGRPLASIYSPDPEVINFSFERNKVILPIYFICGIVEVLVGCLRGMNYPIIPMIPSFLCVCVYRIIWVYTAFRATPTTFILYLSYPISWVLNIIIDAVLYAIFFKIMTQPSKVMRGYIKTATYARAPIPKTYDVPAI